MLNNNKKIQRCRSKQLKLAHKNYNTTVPNQIIIIFNFIDLIVTMKGQMMNYHIQHLQNYFG